MQRLERRSGCCQPNRHRRSRASPNGWIAAGGHDRKLYVWKAANGELVHKMQGHLDNINSVMFSPDGDRLASASSDGTIKIWSTVSADLLATFLVRANRDWLSITPEGFFGASSPGAADLLTVVRRTAVYSVDQMWQSLYAPDLVREKLLGDPDREAASAARVLNLDAVLASGSPPSVSLVSPESGSSTEEVITGAGTHRGPGRRHRSPGMASEWGHSRGRLYSQCRARENRHTEVGAGAK